MIKSTISLLPELLALQKAGVLTDTHLVGEEGQVMVHWGVLARWKFWRELRDEGERGPVTIILPGVGDEQLGDLVMDAYGELKEEPLLEDDNDLNYEDELWEEEKVELKTEVEESSELSFEDDNNLDLTVEDDEDSAIDKFTRGLPAYFVVDRIAIAKAFSYIQSTPTGEKHKTGPWAGREKYRHDCGFVNSDGVQCQYKSGHGVRYLMRHTQGHVTDIYWCTLCGKSMKRTMGHVKTKHSGRSKEKSLEERLQESDFSCSECQKKFLSRNSLNYHVERVHKNNFQFSCSECDYRSMTKRRLDNHIKVKHTRTDLWPCYVCGKELASKHHLDDHVLLHSEASFTCDFCGLKFNTVKSLNLHRNNKHLEKKFVCEYCAKKFAIKSQHDKHVVAIHTKVRNFACKQCDLKCTSKVNLRRHVVIHSDEKRFACPECGIRFKQKEALNRHKLVHSGEKPYGCGHCDFRCQQSYDLTKHYRKVHNMEVKNPKTISVN